MTIKGKDLREAGAAVGRQIADAMTLAQQAIPAMARNVAESMWDAIESFHKPTDVGVEGAPHPYCLSCQTDWPCDESVRLREKREAALR